MTYHIPTDYSCERILKRAAKIISEPGQWTRDAQARDASGRWTSADSPNAVKWSAEGAIIKAAAELDDKPAAGRAISWACKAAEGYGYSGKAEAPIWCLNDAQRSSEPVAEALRIAAKLAVGEAFVRELT